MKLGTEDRRLDLGLQDAPRSTICTRDQLKAQKGRTVRWHQESVHKQRHTAVPMIWLTDPPDLRSLIRTGTYLICWAISEIPRLSHATPEQHSSRYSVHAGTLQSASGIFCILVSNMGQFPELTPVCSQAIRLQLTTLEAGDITLLLEWTPTSTRELRRKKGGWSCPKGGNECQRTQSPPAVG